LDDVNTYFAVFPKDFMIKYHICRNCFPLMALGKYCLGIVIDRQTIGKEGVVKNTRIALYWAIAILIIMMALFYLSQDPSQDPQAGLPINIVHLLTKYRFK